MWIGLLLLFSTHAAAPERPVYDELIRPYEHKIIFYRLSKKTDIAPLRRVGLSSEPRGAESSVQTVIATSPQPVSRQQTIWLPAAKIAIHQDVQAPNLVAKLDVSPPLPAPTKEKPRAFIAPLPNDPRPRLPSAVPVLSTSAPSIGATSIQTPRMETRAPMLPAPAAPALAPSSNTSAGNANADIAIASLNPTEAMRSEIPDGARPGQFSKAPEKGEAATGDATPNAAVIVPNLAVQNSRPKPETAKEAPPVKTILYAERLRNVPLTSFSVPLQPASRAIPKMIDSRFQGRNVYTIVIPIENMPVYGGDWIIWFAEQSQPAGASALLRAPVPFRKLEPVEPSASSDTSVFRVQIAATLGISGKLTDLSVLSNASSAMKQRAIQDATEWEFKPASRNGTPVAVEVILEIPLSLARGLATEAGP